MAITADAKPRGQTARDTQIAALCWREAPCGREGLLVTSRGGGRWILPKGWPIARLGEAGAALREAWEEAGVRIALAAPRPLGDYPAVKRLKSGEPRAVRVIVYPARVLSLAEDWPEAHQRQRRWFALRDAAGVVTEPELAELLARF
ncbi:NUDIX hydrolase [Oceanicella actignis]|uniref:8-oxo-dGTP pyrophosphatase MutT, NUDIX family n=1 Tax=Oceanicella actignis TaxID=1189325 RepID=A0A1M7TS46_9RHOB|nr:NUDIX hydrolase [Oceanicella actignis]TYO85416.1 8-oxo-dGTP pyrophosphatase MutT (NUDIX family) [Oceanicella actignis]SET77150.1 8-oxo-dGTP pyrophosphatase MutT, NUDIX family [Oceanicella actignis]SHN73551.1 8-oxo-dGTP pyrophosphatase MutT, NUDIX family [Oceanicella actignis]